MRGLVNAKQAIFYQLSCVLRFPVFFDHTRPGNHLYIFAHTISVLFFFFHPENPWSKLSTHAISLLKEDATILFNHYISSDEHC